MSFPPCMEAQLDRPLLPTCCQQPAWRWQGSGGPGTMGFWSVEEPAMKPISLIQFLIEERRAGHINAELSLLIEVVARACKRIAVATNKGALGGVLGMAGGEGAQSINIQGEAQKKLDVISNEILLEANAWGGHLAACASEEMEDPQQIRTAIRRATTCCCSIRSTAV